MTLSRLLLSGLKIGVMASMRGSFWFVIIIIPVLGRDILFSFKEPELILIMFFYGFFFGIYSCLLYSLLPGIIGGIILAWWLTVSKMNSPRQLWISGGLLGGLAGLIISISVFLVMSRNGFGEAPFDRLSLTIGAILATSIASGAGVWAAFRFHKMIFNTKESTVFEPNRL